MNPSPLPVPQPLPAHTLPRWEQLPTHRRQELILTLTALITRCLPLPSTAAPAQLEIHNEPTP